jgi:hypothetical protein
MSFMEWGKVFVLMFAVFAIFSIGFVTSYSPLEFVDTGTNPDDFFYGFERTWEGFRLATTGSPEGKAELEAKYLAERYSEMHQMIEDGNYDAARKSSEEAKKIYYSMAGHIDDYDSESNVEDMRNYEGSFRNLVDTHYTVASYGYYEEEIKNLLRERMENGEVTSEEVKKITNEIEEGTARVEVEIGEKEEELINSAVKNSEIQKLEVELIVDIVEKEQGWDGIYEEKISNEKYNEAENKIIEIKELAKETLKNGDAEDAEALFQIVSISELAIQESYNHEILGDDREALKNLNDVVNHLSNVEIDSEGRGRWRGDVNTIPTVEEVIKEQTSRYEDDFAGWDEEVKQDFISRYSPLAIEGDSSNDRERKLENYFNKRKKQAEKVNKLAVKLAGKLDEKVVKLEEEGKSDGEIDRIISKEFSDEFSKAYGEKYMPPGFLRAIGEDEEGNDAPLGRMDWRANGEIIGDWTDKVKYGGGFVEDYEYTDTGGYKFTFTETGYNYVTPNGNRYSTPYPEGYDPETFNHGDEVFTYEAEDGSEWSYSPTGVIIYPPITDPESVRVPFDVDEDNIKKFLYNEQDKYEVVGGGVVDNEPTGYTYQNENGIGTVYEYNPEFNNYIDVATGKVSIPPVSSHKENTRYVGPQTYEYGYGGDTWAYNSETNSWVSYTGKVHTSQISPAPIGYEAKEEYTTPSGETWKYNSEGGIWESTKGKKYYPSPNNYYHYDDRTNYYVDTYGKTYDNRYEGYGKFTDPSGAVWGYNPGERKWNYGDLTYDPIKGETIGESEKNYDYGSYHYGDGEKRNYGYAEGHYVQNPNGRGYSYYSKSEYEKYDPNNPPTYVDSLGYTWKRNQEGIWSNKFGLNPGRYYGDVGEGKRAGIGTEVEYNGENYFVDPVLGWASYNENGIAVAVPPPPGQPSSEVGGSNYYYGGNGNYYSSGNYASVGTSYIYDGQTYSVDSKLGWVDEEGNAVPPPPGQPSSEVGGGGYYYDSGVGYNSYSYSSGSYDDGSGFGHVQQEDGSWVQAQSQEEIDAAIASGTYSAPGSYANYGAGGYDQYGAYNPSYDSSGSGYDSAGGYYDSSGNYVSSGSEGYVSSYGTGGDYSGYYGSYSSGGEYSGYTGGGYGYGSYDSSGTYTGGGGYDSSGSYVGGDYGSYDSGGTYTGGAAYDSGGYDPAAAADGWPGGAYPGGDSSYGTYTGPVGSETDGSEGSGGGDSGSSSGGESGGGDGGSSGGDSGGGDSGGTGAVISDVDSELRYNWFTNWIKSIFS